VKWGALFEAPEVDWEKRTLRLQVKGKSVKALPYEW
jgi:hypothetical protein